MASPDRSPSPVATAEKTRAESSFPLGEFLAALGEHRLLPPEELQQLRKRVETPPRPSTQEIAAELVGDGRLTKWQVARICQRKGGFWVGRYQLREKIGSGGMSVVMKARKDGLGRDVAIKILARTLLRKRTARKRFEREIQAAGALDHPNIVRALDADVTDDVPCLVMEYVEGRTVTSLIQKRGPLPIMWACEFARQAAEGLSAAHELGLIHRDIKPSNLLIRRRYDARAEREGTAWEVKILDFGLARVLSESSEETELTGANQVFGTVDYIAPEQARSARSADERADVYSLGCTLFFMLTGRPPFGGENVMEKLAARLAEKAPSIRTVRNDIPPALDAVLKRMLARRREDRYQTAAEVAEALAPFAEGELEPVPGSSSMTVLDAESDLPSNESMRDTGSELALEGFLTQLDGGRNSDSRSGRVRSWAAWKTWTITGVAASLLILLTVLIWQWQSSPETTDPDADIAAKLREGALFTWKAGEDHSVFTPEPKIAENGDLLVTDTAIELTCGEARDVGSEFSIEAGLTIGHTQLRSGTLLEVVNDRLPIATLIIRNRILTLRLRDGANWSDPITLSALANEVPYHLVLTFQEGRVVCFLNGREVSRDDCGLKSLSNWPPRTVRLGSSRSNRALPLQIERVAVFDMALNAEAAEVLAKAALR